MHFGRVGGTRVIADRARERNGSDSASSQSVDCETQRVSVARRALLTAIRSRRTRAFCEKYQLCSEYAIMSLYSDAI